MLSPVEVFTLSFDAKRRRRYLFYKDVRFFLCLTCFDVMENPFFSFIRPALVVLQRHTQTSRWINILLNAACIEKYSDEQSWNIEMICEQNDFTSPDPVGWKHFIHSGPIRTQFRTVIVLECNRLNSVKPYRCPNCR